MADDQTVPGKIRSIWPPVVLGLMAAGVVIWAQDYGRVPRMMPTIIGSATAILCVLDLLSRLNNPLARMLQVVLGADFRNREMGHDPALREEAVQIGWMVLCVAAILFVGILPTVPLFVLAYMHFFGGRGWGASILSGGIVLGFVFVVFEVLLDYTLYRGVLFDPKGFGAW